jgi:hypothetical protein
LFIWDFFRYAPRFEVTTEVDPDMRMDAPPIPEAPRLA